MKSVQIRTRKNPVFRHFSRSDRNIICMCDFALYDSGINNNCVNSSQKISFSKLQKIKTIPKWTYDLFEDVLNIFRKFNLGRTSSGSVTNYFILIKNCQSISFYYYISFSTLFSNSLGSLQMFQINIQPQKTSVFWKQVNNSTFPLPASVNSF